MSAGPVYVYGVIPSARKEEKERLGALPPNPRQEEPSWTGTLSTGINGEAIRFIRAGELWAIVSAGSAEPIARSRRHMLTHTAVLERVLPHANVLPLRFGTVAPSEDALRACIAGNRAAFLGALRGIEGRVELGLKASWRKGGIYTDIVERDASLRQMRDRLQTRPAGETYYERIELGRRVEAALADRRATETSAILAELLPLAERDAELRQHDEDMVLNRAFLVPREAESAFDAAIARIAERYGEKLDFRYVGPVPPFNFVSLHAGWLTDRSAA